MTRKTGTASVTSAKDDRPDADHVTDEDQSDESNKLETDDDKPEKPEDKDDKAKPARAESTAQLREIRAGEDESLKSILDGLGGDGSFKIHVRRIEPEEWLDPQTGRRVKTAGTLKTYTQRIDEDFLADRHGGGRYVLKFLRRAPDGSFKIATQRTIDIAGDPRVDDVPRTVAAAAGVAPVIPANAENHPSLVKEAFGVLRDQLDRQHVREPAAPRGIDPAVQVLLDQMRRDADLRAAELRELRAELSQARNAKPAEDTFKDKMLGSMIDGESARLVALRQTHESELRQVKDAAVEEQRRREDRHEREIATLRQSFEREIAALKQSFETTAAVTTQSHNLQLRITENDNKRLEREIEALRSEVKDLRSRKDRTIVEQAKDLQAVKDALGLDEGGEKSNFDKLLEVAASPAAVEFVNKIVGGGGAAAQAQAAAAQAQAQPKAGRQLMQDPETGNKVWLVTDAAGQQRLVPAKKKPKVIPATTNPDGTVATPAIELPEVDATAVGFLVGYLERAFAGRQDPEVVAQSGRPQVPDEILAWIRTHDSEQVSGVDLFMSKVAKLPGTSPLASQSGRNWLRKVGKALVGE